MKMFAFSSMVTLRYSGEGLFEMSVEDTSGDGAFEIAGMSVESLGQMSFCATPNYDTDEGGARKWLLACIAEEQESLSFAERMTIDLTSAKAVQKKLERLNEQWWSAEKLRSCEGVSEPMWPLERDIERLEKVLKALGGDR